MSKTYKGQITNNVVELTLQDEQEYKTSTIVWSSTANGEIDQVQGDIPASWSAGSYSSGPIKALQIGSSCTSIGSSAFYYCGSIGPLVIPDSVITIEGGSYAGAFLGTVTPSLTIGNSVTSIGDYAFYLCSFQNDLVIPNSVTSIGYYAFGNCSFLGNAVIPNSVTSIGTYAFNYCTNFTALYTNTPASSWVGSDALNYTSALVNIYTGPNATGYDTAWKAAQATTATVQSWTNYPNIP